MLYGWKANSMLTNCLAACALHTCIAFSDLKSHEIFSLKYFMKYFMKYFKNIKKISRWFTGFTLTRLTFFICQTLPFIHLCILQLPKHICRPTCLVCLFKPFHTIDIEIIFCRMKDYAGHDAGCIRAYV